MPLVWSSIMRTVMSLAYGYAGSHFDNGSSSDSLPCATSRSTSADTNVFVMLATRNVPVVGIAVAGLRPSTPLATTTSG